jgi:RNA polymerase sigma factor (sigma-70 family)
VREASEPAFAALVNRYVNLVYGSALRQLRDRHLAEDVTQAVFLVLANKARDISRETILSGWVFQVTRFACANAVKARARRRRHETAAAQAMAPSLVVTPTENETKIMDALKPLLDEAVSRLSSTDRQAVLLRFFQGQSVKDIAAEMGVSENAASQRLARALTRMRSMFAKKGVTMPAAMTAVASVIVIAAADPAPAAVCSAAVGAGVNDAVNAPAIATNIARKVMKTLFWNWMKPLLASCFALVMALTAGAIFLNRSVDVPHVTAAGGPTTGNVVVCTWEVAVEPELAATVRTLCTPVTTDSRGYQAMKCDGETLVEALSKGQSENLLPVLGFRVDFMRPDLNNGWPDGFPISSGTMGELPGPGIQRGVFFSNSNGKLIMDRRKGFVRLNITVDDATAKLQAGSTPELAGTMLFKGDLPAGESLLFMGQVGPFKGFEVDHLVIWQAIACTEVEAAFVQAIGQTNRCQQWIDDGPDKAVAIAKIAAAWSAGRPAPGKEIAARWTHTLPNGGIVRVLGVSQPLARPFQWWDADGTAIAAPIWPRPDTDLELAVSISDPSIPRRGPMDSNSDSRWEDSAGKDAVFFLPVSTTAGDPIKLTVGFGAGPWKDAAVLKKDQPVTADGATYTLRKFESEARKTANSDGLIHVEMDYTELPDVEMTLAVLEKNGKTVLFDPRPAPLRDRSIEPAEHKFFDSCWVDIEDVDHLVVKTRPRQWTSFEGIASDSKNTAAVRTNPPAPTAPAAGSPEAAMAAMQAAVRAGDLKAVEDSFYAPTQLGQQFADLEARLAMAGTKLAMEAQARFGADDESKVLKDQPYIPSLSTGEETKWQVTGDTAHPIDTEHVKFVGPGLRRIHGVWKTDFTLPPGVNANQLKQQAAAMRPIIALLEDLADATAAGKYHDVYQLRDALADGIKSLRSK